MQQITVLLADDHAMVRAGLASLLGSKKDMRVVGQAKNGREAVAQALALKPDVIIMDLLMPFLNGTEATAEILRTLPETKIVILTSAGAADGIAHALEAGAVGALLKSDDFSSLVEAIRSVARGKRVIAPEIEKSIADNPPLPELTARQEEILSSVMRGLTNADIARQFGIHEQSVKRHINQICDKVGASNRTEAAVIALRKHLMKI